MGGQTCLPASPFRCLSAQMIIFIVDLTRSAGEVGDTRRGRVGFSLGRQKYGTEEGRSHTRADETLLTDKAEIWC